MPQPANACNYFIDPNSEKKLLFPINPHDEPYYIYFNRRRYIMISVLMWASSESEVRKRLLQVIDFRRDCMERYLNNVRDDPQRYEETKGRYASLEAELVELELIIEGVEFADCEFSIEPFAKNHIVQVSWAGNSGILNR